MQKQSNKNDKVDHGIQSLRVLATHVLRFCFRGLSTDDCSWDNSLVGGLCSPVKYEMELDISVYGHRGFQSHTFRVCMKTG